MLPLRVPRSGGALVLLHHRAEHRPDQSGRARRGSEDQHGANRVSLLWQRRRRPRVRFVGLGDLGLSEQRDVASDLAGDADSSAERRRELRDPGAIRVPREHRLGEPETCGKTVRDVDAAALEGRQRSCCTTELHAPVVRNARDRSSTRASSTLTNQPAAL